MPICPHCSKKLPTETLKCPRCKKPLTAYGHPGIPLHYAEDQEYLCDRCLYHQDDTCTFPQRPYAKTCTLYQDEEVSIDTEISSASSRRSLSNWRNYYYRHRVLIWVVFLIAVSVILALLQR